MSDLAFNARHGLSVGPTPSIVIIDGTGNVSANNISINGDLSVSGSITSSGSSASASVYSGINNDIVALVIGTPVYAAGGGTIKRAQATNASPVYKVIGLVSNVSINIGITGRIQTSELLIATTTQWDNITGQIGGLTEGATYYLNPTTPGKLTLTAPSVSGQYVIIMGNAVNSTTFSINIQEALLL